MVLWEMEVLLLLLIQATFHSELLSSPYSHQLQQLYLLSLTLSHADMGALWQQHVETITNRFPVFALPTNPPETEFVGGNVAATAKQVAQVMQHMQQITIPPERFHWDLSVLLLHPFIFWQDPGEPAVGALRGGAAGAAIRGGEAEPGVGALGGPAIAVPAALTPVHCKSIEEVGCLIGTIPETMFTARMQ
eukprot:2906741-Rhodomonas_salina.1